MLIYIDAYKKHRRAKHMMRSMERPQNYEAFQKNERWKELREILITEAGRKVEVRTLIMQHYAKPSEFRAELRKYNIGVNDVKQTD